MPVNYDGPDESVECAYPGCSNKLRRSDFNEPQFCSKEHRDAAAAPLAANDPDTPTEWQEAVDAAHACLALDAAHKYGLVTRTRYGGVDDGAEIAGSGVDIERCEEMLARGAELGYTPAEDAIERYAAELMDRG